MRKKIVLTFDDGPDPIYTPQILDILKRKMYRLLFLWWVAWPSKVFRCCGMVGMPNILIFQIILTLFSPLADLMMVASLFGDNPEKMLICYFVFVLVDLFVGVLAFKMEKEDYRKLIHIIPQRFMWRQLMYYVLLNPSEKR